MFRIFDLLLGLRVYELWLGLWVSNHNDYFYAAHQTRIINKVIKKKLGVRVYG